MPSDQYSASCGDDAARRIGRKGNGEGVSRDGYPPSLTSPDAAGNFRDN